MNMKFQDMNEKNTSNFLVPKSHKLRKNAIPIWSHTFKKCKSFNLNLKVIFEVIIAHSIVQRMYENVLYMYDDGAVY